MAVCWSLALVHVPVALRQSAPDQPCDPGDPVEDGVLGATHSLGQTAWASRQDAVAAVGVWVPALTAGALGLVSRHHPSLNLGRGS